MIKYQHKQKQRQNRGGKNESTEQINRNKNISRTFFYRFHADRAFFGFRMEQALLVFVIASVTDFADGKIARKYGLITDFGKFLDPLADKILVLSALISLCFLADNDIFGKLLLISTVIVIFRELAVTSMRLVTAGCGVVVPANIYGKVKTVSQMFFIILSLAMPLFTLAEGSAGAIVLLILQYALMATMSIMTVISGAVYMKSYWKYINPAK